MVNSALTIGILGIIITSFLSLGGADVIKQSVAGASVLKTELGNVRSTLSRKRDDTDKMANAGENL